MALIFSAIAPHPPLIIPTIGLGNTAKVKNTIAAMQELEGDLYVAQPDTIVIISPHGPMLSEAFSLNLANNYSTNFKEFNANANQSELLFKCDMELLSKIKEAADGNKTPVNITSQAVLDHGSAIPLYFLTQHLPNVKILPISYSLLSYKEHFKFGSLLYKVFSESNKRIAIIASGDLSHRLLPEAPSGYSPTAKAFDDLLVKLLEQGKTKEILNINPVLIEEAGECGLRSIIISLGALKKDNFKFIELSYELPFGVGYLVGEFII